MDEIAELKYDIDRKLEKEAHNLELLKDCLSRSGTNTQNMLGILNSFESRLQHLESTIVPVYNETENLRRRQENIEKTMHTLDTVLSYYHAAKDVEAIVKEGPAACDLDTYLAYMEKVLKAHKYFEQYNPASKELADIKHIFVDGTQALQHEFRSLLNRHGHPVPPVVIVDMLSAEEDLPPVTTVAELPLEHLPEKVVSDLEKISQWLVQQAQSHTHLKSYGQGRAAMLSKSLQGLKDHLRSSSGTSSQLSFISQNSPSLGGKFRGSKDAPSRKSMMKLMNSFTKKATNALNKSGFEPGHRRQGSAANNDSLREEPGDVETDLYINEVSALLRLMQSEMHLMKGIVPQKHERTVFDTIIQQALDAVVSEGELIAGTARKNMQRHEFSAVLSIFPIVRHLRSVKPEVDLILEGCQAPTRAKLASLLSTLDSTGAKALEEFTDSIRNDPDKASNMPRDGTVHELTNHTIIFLTQLQDYAETAGAMLLMHGEQAAPSTMITADTCKMKVADYMTRVLSALGLNLSNKSESYSDQGLRPIFMLNNFNYILKALKRTNLLELLLMWNKDVTKYYDDQVVEQKRQYSLSWSKVLHYILEVDKPMSVQRTQMDASSKLKDKERQNIKDKFTGFNKELEDIHRIQKGYAIPDTELRQQLIKENKEFLVPRYQMFFTKYSVLNFTKNRAKYVKYDVDGVGKMLDSFFDASA